MMSYYDKHTKFKESKWYLFRYQYVFDEIKLLDIIYANFSHYVNLELLKIVKKMAFMDNYTDIIEDDSEVINTMALKMIRKFL